MKDLVMVSLFAVVGSLIAWVFFRYLGEYSFLILLGIAFTVIVYQGLKAKSQLKDAKKERLDH